jgi:hypothetical protein
LRASPCGIRKLGKRPRRDRLQAQRLQCGDTEFQSASQTHAAQKDTAAIH